jgi:pimeloyl-ACP methyl ester carboxylesterase
MRPSPNNKTRCAMSLMAALWVMSAVVVPSSWLTWDRASNTRMPVLLSSDRRPDGMHVTSLLQAHELHGLLEGAAISPPYVVVAHSYGGFVGRLFAATPAKQPVSF